MKPFETICADPPWLFGDRLPGNGRGAAKHYASMTVEDICRFPLPPLAKDCRLFLWRVASMQEEALLVARVWGFRIKAEIVWKKLTKTGKRHFGMGRTVRMEHETCLIGVRGSPPILFRRERSILEAHVGRHSEKPEEVYDLVERLSPGPYVELFARRSRPGWTCLGNEVEPVEGPLAVGGTVEA